MSHRFLQYFCRLSTFCTCRLGLAFVFQLFVGGGGGGDVHANATFVFCFLCSPCSGLVVVAFATTLIVVGLKESSRVCSSEKQGK